MRLRKRQQMGTTDFRKVSERVHEVREERARFPEMLREPRHHADSSASGYKPRDRLRSDDENTQQLVTDAQDIPRIWDDEVPLPWNRQPDPIQTTNVKPLPVPSLRQPAPFRDRPDVFEH
jgi:hypothetical protein